MLRDAPIKFMSVRNWASNDECFGVVLWYFLWFLRKLCTALVFILHLLVNIPAFLFCFYLIYFNFDPTLLHVPQLICHFIMSAIFVLFPYLWPFFWYSLDLCLDVLLGNLFSFSPLSFCALGYVWCIGTAAVTVLPHLSFFHTPVQKNYAASLVTACLKTNLTNFGFTVQL